MFSPIAARGSFLRLHRGAARRVTSVTSVQSQLRRLCLSTAPIQTRPLAQGHLLLRTFTQSSPFTTEATEEANEAEEPKPDTPKRERPLTQKQREMKERRALEQEQAKEKRRLQQERLKEKRKHEQEVKERRKLKKEQMKEKMELHREKVQRRKEREVRKKEKELHQKEVMKRKELREQQKERELQIKQMKNSVLTPPQPLPGNGRLIYVGERMREMAGPEHGTPQIRLQTICAMWRNLSSSEKEAFMERGEENKLANKAAYESWIETYTPHQIRDANRARRSLNRTQKKHWKPLKDHREPQYPQGPYLRFLVEQHSSGDLESIKNLKECTARVAEAWKTTPEWKKQELTKAFEHDLEQYDKKYTELYGEPARPSRRPLKSA